MNVTLYILKKSVPQLYYAKSKNEESAQITYALTKYGVRTVTKLAILIINATSLTKN